MSGESIIINVTATVGPLTSDEVTIEYESTVPVHAIKDDEEVVVENVMTTGFVDTSEDFVLPSVEIHTLPNGNQGPFPN